MNEGSASPNGLEKCNADAAYGVWSNLATLRSQMQHKCVEMSLQITTGLAVGVFALMVSKSANPSSFTSPTKRCLGIVVNLYTILQLLILANYLYHTFLGQIHWLTANEFSQKHDKALESILIEKITPPTPSAKAGAAILNCFQPLIIYSSASIGFLACLGLAWWILSPVCSYLDWLFVIIPIAYPLALFLSYRFHTNMERLAKCWTWVHLKKEDKSVLHLVRNWRTHAPEPSPKH